MNYYSSILEKKDVSFSDFVWHCAEAFIDLDDLRDYEPNSPISLKEENENDLHYKSQIERVKKELIEVQNKSSEEIQCEIDSEYEQNQKDIKSILNKKMRLSERVNKLLQKVNDWTPPTENHMSLKKFMQEGLQLVIERDCQIDHYQKELLLPKQTVEVWRNEHINHLNEDLEYFHEEIINSKKRREDSHKWIKDLQMSVPLP